MSNYKRIGMVNGPGTDVLGLGSILGPVAGVAGAAAATFIIVAVAITLAWSNDIKDHVVDVPAFVTRRDSPCSTYGAFGTPGQVQGFLTGTSESVEAFLDHQIASRSLVGGYVAGAAGPTDVHHYEAGFANASAGTLFTNRTIIRLLSQGKFIGVTAFMAYMSEQNLNGDTILSSILPAYTDTKVLIVYNPVTPLIVASGISTTINSNRILVTTASAHGLTSQDNVTIAGALSAVGGVPAAEFNGVHEVLVNSATTFHFRVDTVATSSVSSSGGQISLLLNSWTLSAPFSMSIGSPTITVTTLASHGFATGDLVGVHMASFATLNGIPAAEINAVQTVNVTGVTTFTFDVNSTATATLSALGGVTRFALLETGVYQTTLNADCDELDLTKVRHYTLVTPNPPIAVRHILEHSLGWSYGRPAGLACTNFVSAGTPYETEAAIQSQIATKLLLSIAADLPGSSTEGQNIKSWATAWAALPLMFHPGQSFSYGPQLSLLGAILETADASTDYSIDSPPRARTLGQYMNETIFVPLGMVDTMFFIQDDDWRRADLLARLSEVYLTQTAVPVVDVLPAVAPFVDWAYAIGRPRGTETIDTGLLSTPADLLRFYQMVRAGGVTPDGTRIVPATLLAEASRTQNLFFNGGVGGYANGALQRGRQATWGYGCAVSTQAHPFQSTSASLGTRSIGWLGAFNTAWSVDFGQNTFMFAGIQGLGGWPELFRTTMRYNEHLSCIDPSITDLPSTLV